LRRFLFVLFLAAFFVARVLSFQCACLAIAHVSQGGRYCGLRRLTNRLIVTGTFARVWLVRLANPAEQDKNKVFALKVLRKADGTHN
jgi:hypothetical protein